MKTNTLKDKIKAAIKYCSPTEREKRSSKKIKELNFQLKRANERIRLLDTRVSYFVAKEKKLLEIIGEHWWNLTTEELEENK